MINRGTIQRTMGRVGLIAAGGILSLMPAGVSLATETPTDQQIQQLLQSASKASDRPDHDFAANSIQNLLEQAKKLQLSQDQTDKIKAIHEHYASSKSGIETAYHRSEMEALKLIHDRHSSLAAVEAAVQKADQEHSKLRMAGITALRQAADVLRPEQYSQWRQNHASSQVAQSGREAEGEPAELERRAPH